MESIRLTGGIVPDNTWDENWENIQAIARIAQSMQIRLVTFHAGFLPHEERDPEFAKLLHRLRLVADIFAASNIELGLETGQETASSLDAFLRKLQRANVGVNFDPANMILYDKGNPIESLKSLGPWLRQCHIKDANRTRVPGAWGEEVPVGQGQVDWNAFFAAASTYRFRGKPLHRARSGTAARGRHKNSCPVGGNRRKALTMINVAIVGLGFMAATHIKAYRQLPGVRIAGLCNPSGRHLDGDFSNVSGNVGDNQPVKLDMTHVKATRDLAELLNDPEIHLIDICAPTSAHRDLSIAALQAGKHVLCEKPLARSIGSAREIIEAAGKARGIFMPAMCLRFWPEWAWIRNAIVSNCYGKTLSARFRRVAEPPGWGHKNFLNGNASGGALFDLHVHDTDFILYCFGPPQSVLSSGYSKISGAIDHVVTQ